MCAKRLLYSYFGVIPRRLNSGRSFFTWCAEFPMSWLRSPAKYLESWEVGTPLLLTVDLRGTLSLCILGSPYSLGDLEQAGRGCLQISSVSGFFKQ